VSDPSPENLKVSDRSAEGERGSKTSSKTSRENFTGEQQAQPTDKFSTFSGEQPEKVLLAPKPGESLAELEERTRRYHEELAKQKAARAEQSFGIVFEGGHVHGAGSKPGESKPSGDMFNDDPHPTRIVAALTPEVEEQMRKEKQERRESILESATMMAIEAESNPPMWPVALMRQFADSLADDHPQKELLARLSREQAAGLSPQMRSRYESPDKTFDMAAHVPLASEAETVPDPAPPENTPDPGLPDDAVLANDNQKGGFWQSRIPFRATVPGSDRLIFPYRGEEDARLEECTKADKAAWEKAYKRFPQLQRHLSEKEASALMKALVRNELHWYSVEDRSQDGEARKGKLSLGNTAGYSQITPRGVQEFETGMQNGQKVREPYPQLTDFLKKRGHSGKGHETQALQDPDCVPMIVAAKLSTLVDLYEKSGTAINLRTLAYGYNADVTYHPDDPTKFHAASLPLQAPLEQSFGFKKAFPTDNEAALKESVHLKNVEAELKRLLPH